MLYDCIMRATWSNIFSLSLTLIFMPVRLEWAKNGRTHKKSFPLPKFVIPSDQHQSPLLLCHTVSMTAEAPLSDPSSCILWIMDLHSGAAQKNTSHGNEVQPQDTTHRMQRPCFQDPTGNRTTRRPPDHRRKAQTKVVWTCFPFIRSGQNHLARHSERGKKTRQTEKGVGRHHQGMDRPGVRQVPEGSEEQRKMEETGCEVICGNPTTLRLGYLYVWCK